MNNYAISTADLAQSLTKSSGSLVAANGTLQEAVALTAAANTIIQDADVVGTALKTVAMRLRGTSVTEMEEEGLDTEGAVESKSKLQSQIQKLSGVNILTDAGAYKSTYEILSEIAEVWEDIDDMDQAALLELLAGKRAGSVMSAILQNPDTLKDAFESANDAAGSALKENETYLDSVQGRLDLFANAVQTMWQNAISSETMKFFVDIGSKLIKLIDNVGLLKSVLIATSLIIMKINHMSLIEFFGSISGTIVKVATRFANFGKSVYVAMTGAKTATSTLTAATLEQAAANGTITTSEAIRQATTNGLVLSQISLTDAEAMAALSTTTLNEAEKQAIINKLGLSSAVTTLTMATLGQAVAEDKITAAEAAHLGVATGLMAAQMSLNAAKATDILTSQGVSEAHAQEIVLALGLGEALKPVTVETITLAIANGALAPELGAVALGLLSVDGAAKTAAGGFTALWTAIWPILALLVGAAVIWGTVKLIDHLVVTTDELADELNDLKTELSDVESEIDNVNSELETMEERMAELLAKDTLTFTEEEELKRMQAENAELQRKLDLLNLEKKYKQEEASRALVDTMGSAKSDKYDITGKQKKWWHYIVGFSAAAMTPGQIGKDGTTDLESLLDSRIESYQNYQNRLVEIEKQIASTEDKDEYDKLNKEKQRIEDAMGSARSFVQTKIGEFSSNAEGLEYFTGDDLEDWQIEANETLDYIYNLQDAWAVAQGAKNAKSNAVNRIFNKEENAEISDSINEYVEALQNGDTSARASIENIIKNNKDLVADIEASGLHVDDAVSHFSSFASELEFATLDKKVEEMQLATEKMKTLLLDSDMSDFEGLFDAETGEASATAIAEYFQGTSDATREEVAKLIKKIKDEEINIQDALKQFEIFSVQASLDIYIEEVQTNFKDVFVELDEADGLISTFEELGEAIGSTADALEVFSKAEAETINSGRVSIETALELMKYTDDYGSILQVVDGKLQLVDGAEEALIQTRIDAIKTSAEASLSDATNAYNKAKLATQTYKDALTTDMSAEVVAKSWEKVLAAGAGLMAGVKSLLTGDTWVDAYNTAYNDTLSEMTGYETSYDDSGLQKLVDAEKEAKAAMEAASDRVELANQLTPETLKSINDADDVDTKEEAIKSWYEKQIALLDNQQQHIQNQIDILEAKGEAVSASYYEEQIALEEKKIGLYESELGALQKLEYSDENVERMWELEHAIQESTLNMIEFRKSIVDLYDEAFNKVNEAYDKQEDFLQDQQDYIEKYAELNEDYAGSAIKANIGIEEDKLEDSQNRLDALKETFNTAFASGYLEEGSEEWVKMQGEIRAAEAAVLDSQLAIKQYKEELADLASDKFSDVISAFDERDELYSDRQSYIETRMDLENTTDSQKKSGYRDLIALENARMSSNRAELTSLISLRDKYVKDGAIKYGSEQWLEMTKSIRETEAAILDNEVALEEYNKDLKQLEVDAFNNVRDAFGQKDDFYSTQQSYVEGYISRLEALGIGVPEEAYEGLIDIEKKKQINNLTDLKDARQGLLDLEKQGFDASSEEWQSAYKNITDLEKKIQDSDVAMAKWNKTIRDMEFDRFDAYIGRIDDINGKLENLHGLTSKEDYATEDGEWTDDGITSLGLLYQQMTNAQVKADEYAKKIEELNKEYEDGEMSESEYYERLKKLEDGQWDAVNAYESSKESMVDMEEARIDMIEEGINKEIEAYEELINLKKEELDAERDLYEFKKNIQNQSKDIAALERRIASLSGSTSASDIAERRRLEAELQEAREGLNDTYYDHSRDQQGKALDDEMESFKSAKEQYVETLRETLDDVAAVVDGLISTVLINSEAVLEGMNRTASAHGITLSGSLTEPWANASNSVAAFGESVATKIGEIKTVIENSTAPLTGELGLPWNNLTAEDGPISTFSSTVSTAIDAAKTKAIESREEMQKNLEDPFNKGSDAASTFGLDATTAITNAETVAYATAASLTSNLTQPWKDAESAANTFSTKVADILEDWADKAETEAARVQAATTVTYPDYVSTGVGGGGSGNSGGSGGGSGGGDSGGGDGETAAQKLEKARKAAQAYVDKAGFSEGDKARWGQDKNFLPLLQALIKEGGSINDLKGKVYKQIKTTGTINSSAYSVSGMNSISWGADDFTVVLDGASYKVATGNAFISPSGSTKLNNLFGGAPSVGSLAMLDKQLFVYHKNKVWKSIGSKNKGDALKTAFYNKLNAYAKGTMGTTKDQWALTDEPQFGDELVLVPGKDGNLSFMRKGTGVVPADLTANLMEWGQFTPDSMNLGGGVNVNMINNAVNRPEFNFNFDALVKAERIDENTLPEVKKFVQQEINSLVKQMNYAIKGKGGR